MGILQRMGDLSGERPAVKYGLVALGLVIVGNMALGSRSETPQTVASGPATCSDLKYAADKAEQWAANVAGAQRMANTTTAIAMESSVNDYNAKALAAIAAWSRQCAH